MVITLIYQDEMLLSVRAEMSSIICIEGTLTLYLLHDFHITDYQTRPECMINRIYDEHSDHRKTHDSF